MYGSGDKDAMFASVERVRSGFAKMVHADADEVAITKNVSEGLNAIIASLPFTNDCSSCQTVKEQKDLSPVFSKV